MNIIIVGCGKVGRVLAERLNEQGNSITVVDINSVRVNETAERYDVMGIAGDGVNFRVDPSTQSRIIATYKRGKEVTVTGASGEWLACTIDGKTGYVSAQFISYTSP